MKIIQKKSCFLNYDFHNFFIIKPTKTRGFWGPGALGLWKSNSATRKPACAKKKSDFFWFFFEIKIFVEIFNVNFQNLHWKFRWKFWFRKKIQKKSDFFCDRKKNRSWNIFLSIVSMWKNHISRFAGFPERFEAPRRCYSAPKVKIPWFPQKGQFWHIFYNSLGIPK